MGRFSHWKINIQQANVRYGREIVKRQRKENFFLIKNLDWNILLFARLSFILVVVNFVRATQSNTLEICGECISIKKWRKDFRENDEAIERKNEMLIPRTCTASEFSFHLAFNLPIKPIYSFNLSIRFNKHLSKFMQQTSPKNCKKCF